jgi:hypothetical protein
VDYRLKQNKGGGGMGFRELSLFNKALFGKPGLEIGKHRCFLY